MSHDTNGRHTALKALKTPPAPENIPNDSFSGSLHSLCPLTKPFVGIFIAQLRMQQDKKSEILETENS